MAIQEQIVLSKDANGDVKLTQNSVAPFTSINAGAVVNTVYLKEGNVGIGTDAPGGKLNIVNSLTSNGLYINQTGVLAASKYGLYVYSNAVQVNSHLVYIHQGNGASSYTVLKIDNDSTANAMQITQNGVLDSTRHALFVASSAANVNADSALIKVYQANSDGTEPIIEVINTGPGVGIELKCAGYGVGIEINNDTTNHGLYIHQDGILAATKYALIVESNAINVNSVLVRFDQLQATTDDGVLRIGQKGTGYGIYIDYNGVAGVSQHPLGIITSSAQVTSPLCFLRHDNAGSTTPVLEIDNDGTGHALFIMQNGATGNLAYFNNAGTHNGLYIVQVGNLLAGYNALRIVSSNANAQTGDSLVFLKQNHASSTQSVLEIDNDGTGHGIYICKSGVLATSKYGLYVYSNAVQTNSNLVHIHQDNAGSTASVASILNDGTGNALYIVQLGALASGYNALRIIGGNTNAQVNAPLVFLKHGHASSTEPVLEIDNDGTGHALFITQNGISAAGDAALRVYSDAAQTNVVLAVVHQSSQSATQAALEVRNDGSGSCLYVYIPAAQSNGIGLEINNDGTNHALYIHQDVALASTKYALYIDNNATPVDGAGRALRFDGCTISSTKNPESDVEAGFLAVNIDGTQMAIPYYTLS